MRSIFHKYYLGDFTVDVFGYDKTTEQFDYAVETKYSCKVRKAKKYYKSPDKRNEWLFPYGLYINVITPLGGKKKLFLDD